LLGFFFDPEDGGDMFFENISWLSVDYMALYPELFITTAVRTSDPAKYVLIVHAAQMGAHVRGK
jgi:hypothetical protein